MIQICVGTLSIPIFLCIFSQILNRLYTLSDKEISSFLYHGVLLGGLGSLIPMLYIAVDGLQCLNVKTNKMFTYDGVKDACAGMFYSGFSNSNFLLLVGYSKVVLLQLTSTTVSRDSLISGRLPFRLQLGACLVFVSALGNLYLYVNREPELAINHSTKTQWMATMLFSTFAVLAAVLLESVSVLFFQRRHTAEERIEDGTANEERGRSTTEANSTLYRINYSTRNFFRADNFVR